MKAVILAAGEGKRMRPLTLKTPKPLLSVNGKPIIDYIFDSLPPEIDEVIIVVKYLAEQIKKYIGTKNRGFKISYVLGSNKGSAYSFMASKKYLRNERFLFIHGDELLTFEDVSNCLRKKLSLLTFESKNPQAHGIGYLRNDGTFKKIVEKPKDSKSNLGVDGVMVLNTDIFAYEPQSVSGEFHFSTMVGQFVRDHKVFPVASRGSIFDITTPYDLVRAGKILEARKAVDII